MNSPPSLFRLQRTSTRKFGIVVIGLDEVGELPSILPAEESARGLRARRRRVGSGDEHDPRDQVNEEIAAQSFAVVGEAPPAEETDWDRTECLARR